LRIYLENFRKELAQPLLPLATFESPNPPDISQLKTIRTPFPNMIQNVDTLEGEISEY